jgi:hypothetical protein
MKKAARALRATQNGCGDKNRCREDNLQPANLQRSTKRGEFREREGQDLQGAHRQLSGA